MIKNLDKLNLKVANLSQSVSDGDFKNSLNATNKQIVQAYAKLLCPVNHEELRQHIFTSIDATADKITATTFTDTAYANYVEFGTGPIGEANHEGISPEVTPAYVQHGWGIPADKVDPADAEMYNWPKRNYQGKDYYMTSGQPARPFMYPALKNNEGKVTKEVSKKLANKIRKAANK